MLLRIVGALTAPTSSALMCRWRSRPQHQERSAAQAPGQTLAAYKLPANTTTCMAAQGSLLPLWHASQLARNRQGRDQLPAVALGAQLRRQLIRDVPGEDDGAVRLVGEQAALLDHRDRRPR